MRGAGPPSELRSPRDCSGVQEHFFALCSETQTDLSVAASGSWAVVLQNGAVHTMVLGPVASPSPPPGRLLEMQIIGSCPRPTESWSVGEGPSNLFEDIVRVSLCSVNVESHGRALLFHVSLGSEDQRHLGLPSETRDPRPSPNPTEPQCAFAHSPRGVCR